MRPVGHVSLKESAEPSQASSFKCPEFLQASVGFSQVSAMMVAKRAEMLLRLGFTGGPAPSLLWPAATYRVGISYKYGMARKFHTAAMFLRR